MCRIHDVTLTQKHIYLHEANSQSHSHARAPGLNDTKSHDVTWIHIRSLKLQKNIYIHVRSLQAIHTGIRAYVVTDHTVILSLKIT